MKIVFVTDDAMQHLERMLYSNNDKKYQWCIIRHLMGINPHKAVYTPLGKASYVELANEFYVGWTVNHYRDGRLPHGSISQYVKWLGWEDKSGKYINKVAQMCHHYISCK